MQIKIKPDASVTILGMKGTGKTTLMTHLINQTRPTGTGRIVIYDSKQVGDFTAFPAVSELKELHKLVASNPVVVYAPNRDELHDLNFHEAFFAWCFERWNTRVVVDELTSIVWGNNVPNSYKDVTDRGRAKHVTIIQGNQKPVFVPHSALSEADHYFMFDLMVATDRDKMAGILGSKVKKRPPDLHGFWYFHKSMREPTYCPGLSL